MARSAFPRVNVVSGVVDAVTVAGTVTAPAASAAIVAGGIPPAGAYRLLVGYILTGTAETALLNVRLIANGGTYVTLPSLTGAGWTWVEIPRLVLNGTNAVNLLAVANATGGSQYSGIIVQQKISN